MVLFEVPWRQQPVPQGSDPGHREQRGLKQCGDQVLFQECSTCEMSGPEILGQSVKPLDPYEDTEKDSCFQKVHFNKPTLKDGAWKFKTRIGIYWTSRHEKQPKNVSIQMNISMRR